MYAPTYTSHCAQLFAQKNIKIKHNFSRCSSIMSRSITRFISMFQMLQVSRFISLHHEAFKIQVQAVSGFMISAQRFDVKNKCRSKVFIRIVYVQVFVL